MRRCFTAFTLLLAFATVACTERSTVQEGTEDINRIGDYEDFQNNRVMAFTFTTGTSAEAIKEHALNLAYRSERLLAAYYYEEGSRTIAAKDLRWARSIMQANDLLYDTPDLDPWHYAFMRNFVNEARFTDCNQTPDDALCRRQELQ